MKTDATATFAINLEGNTEGAAEDAAKALENLGARLNADTKALAAMNRAMKNLQQGTVVPIQQANQLRAAITAKKNAIAQAQSAYIALGGTFTSTRSRAGALENRFAAMMKQAQQVPGPLGVLVKQFESFKAAVGGGAIAAGIIGIVGGLGLLVAATSKAVGALFRYGIAQADARRSELLRLEGLTKLRNWWGIAAGNAGELQGAIDQVSASTALGRDKVAAYAEQLYRMHLRGQNLADALEGVAIKATTQGEAQASMFASWAAGAALTGRSVRRLADDVKARLGGIAQAQMLSLSVQAEKQREAFNALFGGLKVDNFLKAMSGVRNLLGQSTNSGRALKALLTSMLQPLIDAATAAAPVVKRFFQGVIIGALRVGIMFQEVRLALKRTFGSPDILRGFDLQKAALKAGEWGAKLFAGGLFVAGVFVGGLAIKLTTMLVPALWNVARALVPLAIRGLVIAAPFIIAAAAIWSVINTTRLLVQLWKEIDFKLLGQYMWQGIKDGLNAGKAALVEAVEGLAASTMRAFKKALGIASPSKLFMRLGVQIPAGVGMGVQSGAPALRRAVGKMVQPPAIALARPRAADLAPSAPRFGAPGLRAAELERSGAARALGAQVTVGDIHVHTHAQNARGIVLDIKRELESVLEGVALQVGASTRAPA